MAGLGWLLLGITMAGCAVASLTPTPEATQTLTPSPTLQATGIFPIGDKGVQPGQNEYSAVVQYEGVMQPLIPCPCVSCYFYPPHTERIRLKNGL
jgi:hypothetical protein